MTFHSGCNKVNVDHDFIDQFQYDDAMKIIHRKEGKLQVHLCELLSEHVCSKHDQDEEKGWNVTR